MEGRGNGIVYIGKNNVIIEWLALLICIWEVLASIFGVESW